MWVSGKKFLTLCLSVKKGMSKWRLPFCFCKAAVVNDQKSMLLAAFNFTTKIRQPAVG